MLKLVQARDKKSFSNFPKHCGEKRKLLFTNYLFIIFFIKFKIMIDYINPFDDFVFKYIFGRKETSDCLLSLINAILADTDMEKIVSIKILNPFNLKEFNEDKYSILDIRAEDENGDIYNIEVQLTGNEEFKYRSLYYWARVYSSQLKESEIYANLKPVICINILLFNLIKDLDSFHTCFLPYEYKNKDILLTEHFQLHFLEIPKFTKSKQKINNKLQIWFDYLLLEGKNKEESMKGILDKNDDIKKAHKEFKKFTADDKMRELYEARLKKKRDEASLLKHAKLEGEKNNALKTAKNMLAEGEPIEKISKYTGLSFKEIEELKD